MKLPKYSIDDIVLVVCDFNDRVCPMIIDRIHIDKRGVSYQGKDGFEGDDIIIYNEKEFNFGDSVDPVYRIIGKVGNRDIVEQP